jgi:carbon starvation protein
MLALLFVAGSAVLLAGYVFYSRRLERLLGVTGDAPTPAVTRRDGVDYVPARAAILFGHHFSSIAGAGPIVGPVIAAMAFGWLPAFAWILLGAVLIGGVHDYATLVASIRHEGRSIAEVARSVISPPAQKILIAFIWLTLIYVLVVFLDLTATTFVADGGVATSSIFFMALAVLFGLSVYRLRMSTPAATLIFVPLLFAAVFVGEALPIQASSLPVLWGTAAAWKPALFWSLILTGYCYVASVLPVWMLLQPRDYLSSYLLYATVLACAIGLLFGGFSFAFPALTGFNSGIGPLFPALFVTIACGAVSGFHSVISSGTTAKQLAQERDARKIGYGAMIVEGAVALIALCTVAMLARDSEIVSAYKANKVSAIGIFSAGMGRFVQVFGLRYEFGVKFGGLAISAFLLTTLDTCCRLGRFLFHEFFGIRSLKARFATTALVVALPMIFLLLPFRDAQGHPVPAWKAIWPVFGTANQLLAGLGLLIVTVWVRRQGKPVAWVAVPMIFMFAITLTSLVTIVASGTQGRVVDIVAGLLFALSVVMIAMGLRKLVGRAGRVAARDAARPSEG